MYFIALIDITMISITWLKLSYQFINEGALSCHANVGMQRVNSHNGEDKNLNIIIFICISRKQRDMMR